MGKFHVVVKTDWPIQKKGKLPFRKVTGVGLSRVFEVEPELLKIGLPPSE